MGRPKGQSMGIQTRLPSSTFAKESPRIWHRAGSCWATPRRITYLCIQPSFPESLLWARSCASNQGYRDGQGNPCLRGFMESLHMPPKSSGRVKYSVQTSTEEGGEKGRV